MYLTVWEKVPLVNAAHYENPGEVISLLNGGPGLRLFVTR